MKLSITILSVTLFLILHQNKASAQPGTLDPGFGNAGLVTTFVASNNDHPTCSALQNDGKILVAGYSLYDTIAYKYGFALVRYNSDGSLDTTFNGTGKVITIVNGSSSAYAYAIAIQPDNKILLTGSASIGSGNQLAMVRYHTSGIVDTTFGTHGIVTTPIGTVDDRSTSILLQDDGKIVLAGFTKNSSGVYYFAIARYDSIGTLDTTFSNDGINTTPFNGNDVRGNSVALHQDGSYYVLGTVHSITTYYFAMTRYHHDGTLDLSFGTAGTAAYAPGTGFNDFGVKIIIQPDGKLLLFGQAETGSTKMCILRYNTNGALDPTFNSSGKIIVGQGINYLSPGDMALQPDGKMVITGTVRVGTDYNFILARIDSSGTIDNTFGNAGLVTTAFGSNKDNAYSVNIQPDEKIVVAGKTTAGNSNNFALARYFGDLSVGLPESVTQANDIVVYPNPMKNKLIIQLTNDEPAEILLYDMASRKLLQQTFRNTITLNTDQLSNGIYFYELRNKNGMIRNGKVIKE